MKSSPVVFFVFKRPKSTKLFLDLIKESGTKKVYIFADEGRDDNEKRLASKVRELINSFAKDNKDLNIIPYFAKENKGLKKNIIDGLNFVFTKEDRAIILEDDCLPHQDFFKFTNTMLEKYKDDQRVMSVTGTSVGQITNSSYSFTRYQQCWGWATWERAWKLYDSNMTMLNSNKWKATSAALWPNIVTRFYWNSILHLVKVGQIKTWDFQWSFAHFIHGGLAIMPSVNLITNIGFDSAATNTKIKSAAANMETSSLEWPLQHPQEIVESSFLTHKIETSFYSNPIAYVGMFRQYTYYLWRKYAPWH